MWRHDKSGVFLKLTSILTREYFIVNDSTDDSLSSTLEDIALKLLKDNGYDTPNVEPRIGEFYAQVADRFLRAKLGYHY